MHKHIREIFGAFGLKVITFLVACLVIVLGFVWNGLLGRMDSMDKKLDKVVKIVYEEEVFVKIAYFDKDIKPWLRNMQDEIRKLRSSLLPKK